MANYYSAKEGNDIIIFDGEFLDHFKNAEYLGEFESAEEARKEFEWREARKNTVYCYLGNMYEVYNFNGKYCKLWNMSTGEEMKVTTKYIRNSKKFEICAKIGNEWHALKIEH